MHNPTPTIMLNTFRQRHLHWWPVLNVKRLVHEVQVSSIAAKRKPEETMYTKHCISDTKLRRYTSNPTHLLWIWQDRTRFNWFKWATKFIGWSIAAHEATVNWWRLLIPLQVWVHARLQHSSEPADHDVPNTLLTIHRLLTPTSSIANNETVTATFSDHRILQTKIQQ